MNSVKLLRLCGLLLVLLTAAPRPGVAQVVAPDGHEVPNGFLKAGQFLDLTERDQGQFVMGFVDGLFMASALGASDEKVLYISRCIAGMDNRQLAAIIRKHLRACPETWHEQLNMHAWNALAGVCYPQPKK